MFVEPNVALGHPLGEAEVVLAPLSPLAWYEGLGFGESLTNLEPVVDGLDGALFSLLEVVVGSVGQGLERGVGAGQVDHGVLMEVPGGDHHPLQVARRFRRQAGPGSPE